MFSAILLILTADVIAQVELVPVQNPVYSFLKRMQLKNVIDFNSSALPLSRKEVSDLIGISLLSKKLSIIDKAILKEYQNEFGYELGFGLSKSSAFFKEPSNVFKQDKQKNLYNFADSNATLFIDGTGYLSLRKSSGDSLGDHSIGLGELGMRFRGTVKGILGYYIRLSNGASLTQKSKNDLDFLTATNPYFLANSKFQNQDANTYDSYEGYMRIATKDELLSLTVGREALTAGFGYIDKLFLSTNTVPYNYVRADVKYKALEYFFLYGSLKGDSLGIKDIESKFLVTHRLTMNFSPVFKMGIFESLIISDSPFNFTYINPLSFIRSADYNAGVTQSDKNNALLGFDLEVKPAANIAAQASLLIDDLNFSTIFSGRQADDRVATDNRFGIQLGTIWTDAFTLPNLTASLEYSRLDPFVYTHRTNKSNYTNWKLPLGHDLPPNSDEIALNLDYSISSRLKVNFLYQHQRMANGFLIRNDSLIINYGGNIERGDGDIQAEHKFLEGNRSSRDLVTLGVRWEPIKQIYLDLKAVKWMTEKMYNNTKLNDTYFFVTLSTDF
ncbi:hypothetical protein BH10BAC5_BH10BAC5_11630 [soil metagenome]